MSDMCSMVIFFAFFYRQQLFCFFPQGFDQVADPVPGLNHGPVICRLIAPVRNQFQEHVIQFLFRSGRGFPVFGRADFIPEDFYIIEIADSEGEIDQTETSLGDGFLSHGCIIDTAGIVHSRFPVFGPGTGGLR